MLHLNERALLGRMRTGQVERSCRRRQLPVANQSGHCPFNRPGDGELTDNIFKITSARDSIGWMGMKWTKVLTQCTLMFDCETILFAKDYSRRELAKRPQKIVETHRRHLVERQAMR